MPKACCSDLHVSASQADVELLTVETSLQPAASQQQSEAQKQVYPMSMSANTGSKPMSFGEVLWPLLYTIACIDATGSPGPVSKKVHSQVCVGKGSASKKVGAHHGSYSCW